MAVASPPPISFNPVRRVYEELRSERAARRVLPLPPGYPRFSLRRTRRFARDPVLVLLEAYEDFGPVFTLRVLYAPVVFMIGPEANHFVTVSHAHLFRWRDGFMGDLIPLLGDGLLTTDGDYHRLARRIMLPAFHRERVAGALDAMAAETSDALDQWAPGESHDLYAWTRDLALRIAMRALLGFDPDRASGRVDAASEFEHALAFYGRDYLLQSLRGPATPWARMAAARRRLDGLILGEIAERRRSGRRGDDVMSLLLDAREEEGEALSDAAVRDQVMTLLFAGHDTTTSTVSFLVYELGRNPAALDRLLEEQDAVLGGRAPTAADLTGGLPQLDMAVDETLRLYPAAWIGPRRSVEDFEFAGVRVPGGVPVEYCSWVSHRLPEVFPEPEAFRPDRFSPEARARLPKGAYVPFGGGSRTCIGMRFGLLEVKTIATLLLQRFGVELRSAEPIEIRQMPTLSPKRGLPVTVRERRAAA